MLFTRTVWITRTVLVWRYLYDFAAMRQTWSRWALALTGEWTDSAGDPALLEAARLVFAGWLQQLDDGAPLRPLPAPTRRSRPRG